MTGKLSSLCDKYYEELNSESTVIYSFDNYTLSPEQELQTQFCKLKMSLQETGLPTFSF